MFEMDKQKFGAFIAALRKEKGYTQKELAELLYVSNKAVSKWETGVSIPDTTLLVPLAEALGVSVTELLTCEKSTGCEPVSPVQTEELVKTVIGLSESGKKQYRPDRVKKGIQLLLCAVTGLLEVGLLLHLGYAPEELSLSLTTMMLLMFVFGLYFCSFASAKLPSYYDDNRISSFSDGFFRMNLPGVSFNNHNWPYIIRAAQLWALIGLPASPALYFVVRTFFPALWHNAWIGIMLLVSLGGLFLPIVIVGRKYEYAPDSPRPARQIRRDWIWISACLALILLLTLAFPVTGLNTTGSGTRIGWSEGKTLDSWNASFTYFQGYRQRVINIQDQESLLHMDIAAEEGTFEILVTDLNDQVLFAGDYSEPVSLNIPLPGKARVRITGENLRGSFYMGW